MLNLPQYNAKIIEREDGQYIYDELRTRYIRLTPEEWVRQNFVHYLIDHKGYPSALMGNEVSITVGKVTRRCDTVLYSSALPPRPLLLVECKAPSVPITKEVLEQAYRYNLVLNVPYIVLTNGTQHYCYRIDYRDHSVSPLREIPHYSQL